MYNYCYTVRGGRLKGVKSGGTAESKAHSSCKGCEPFFLLPVSRAHKDFLRNRRTGTEDYAENFLYRASALTDTQRSGVEVRRARENLQMGKSDRDAPQIGAGVSHTDTQR